MAIVFTKERLDLLASYVMEGYISELASHCDTSFPHLRVKMGSQNLYQALRQSVDKAKNTGFTQKDTVQFYIDLQITFGWEFDNDPQYSWIKKILIENQDTEQIEKSTILYDEVETYLTKLWGNDRHALTNQINHMARLDINALNNKNVYTLQEILSILEVTYPAKFAVTSKQLIENLARFSKEKDKSNHYEFFPIVPMFLLGCGYKEDPYLSWMKTSHIHLSMESESMQLESPSSDSLYCYLEQSENLFSENKRKG